MQSSLQFYPTPPALALKAWHKFENKKVTRLLEPSAGQGSLVSALHDYLSCLDMKELRRLNLPFLSEHCEWDAIEINPTFHPLLRNKKAKVIGYDFLSFQHGAAFSHIIMNPPFAHGVHHVLHAWDILFDGEVVAIVNAETVKNPYSKERKHLVRLIEEHGSVEFLQETFTTEETLRKTDVEVALIHLKKQAQSNQDLLSYLSDLTKKETQTIHAAQGMNEVTLPNNFIENAITNYNLAIQANIEAQIAINKAQMYKSRLSVNSTKDSTEVDALELNPTETLKSLMSREHQAIHHNAWLMIINSSIVTSKLSSSTAKEVERQLNLIYELAFNATNIYGFLAGLASQRGEIQKNMILEVFDNITRYHSENTCYYFGWKSNDKHRTVGKSIKMSRFILPLGQNSSWSRSAGVKTLQDIEATFLYLDGKVSAEISLPAMFDEEESFKELCQGERLTTDYFDIRYYPKRGTMHFFPNRADLVRRLNIFAGKARQWLPEDMHQADAAFVEQFDNSEKVSKKFDLVKELKLYSSMELNREFNDGDSHTMKTIVDTIIYAQEQLGLTPLLENKVEPGLLEAPVY